MAPEQDAFALTEPPAHGLHVVLRGALKEFDLRVPPFPASITNRQTLAWNVRAYVETDDEGKARNVFAEASSAEPWVRAEVIRTLQASRLAKPAPPCAGRVEVGYEP